MKQDCFGRRSKRCVPLLSDESAARLAKYQNGAIRTLQAAESVIRDWSVQRTSKSGNQPVDDGEKQPGVPGPIQVSALAPCFQQSGQDLPMDIGEVVNCIRAMKYGLRRIDKLPLSFRLIREIHAELLTGARGQHQTPGEFRRSQNWIGPAGAGLSGATFVPPPVPDMHQALDKLERFLYNESLPNLIHCGLVHAQFETIHPFLDGNGRIGRLLITFLLCQRQVLHQPLLYVSHYLKAHRSDYYDSLMAVRNDADWEGWLRFFLRGIAEVSRGAIDTARKILALRDQDGDAVSAKMGGSAASGLRLLDYLFTQPILSVRMVERRLGISFVTASKLVERLVELQILKETTGGRRNRRYAYGPYLVLFESPEESEPW
ncbi:MAG TPA: Fic family protein [Blastocatellia bacterium]